MIKPKISIEVGYNHLGSKYFLKSIVNELLNYPYDLTFQFRTTHLNSFNPKGYLQLELEYLLEIKNFIKKNTKFNNQIGISIDSLDNFSFLNKNFDFIKVLSFTEDKDSFFQKIETNKNIYLSCGTEKFENFLKYHEVAKKRNLSLNFIYTSFDPEGLDISKKEIEKLHELKNLISFGLHQKNKEVIYLISTLFNIDRVFIYINPGFQKTSIGHIPDSLHSLSIKEIDYLCKMLSSIENFKTQQPRNEFRQFQG